MRKLFVFFLFLALLCGLAVNAGAATGAKSVSAYATVSSDGSCQVTMTANIHLDSPVENLRFPLPGKSSNVTVNGARARSRVENGLRQVDVSGIAGRTAGDFTLTFTYSLRDLIVTNEAGLLELQLPLLAGFAYPIQALEFSVTLPGPVTAKPAFSSGYHQANIEKDIYTSTNGATITGMAQAELKDHETLSMSLLVTEEMFPQTRLAAPNFKTVNTLTAVFALLALLYWVIFLRTIPTWPTRQPTPPEGYTAGELGSVLHLQGGNLHMMVFSWAQLGYLTIRLEPGGKVRLFRQMEMGNERGGFEQRCFKLLFGKASVVDTDTLRYAELCRGVERMQPNLATLVHPKSGNLRVFRGLAAVNGLFFGVSMGIGLSSGAALQWLLVILLGSLALLSSWHMQKWAVHLYTAEKRPLWLALVLAGVWLAIGALAGQFSIGLNMVLCQLFAGLLAAFGGRRTLAGRQAMGEILGLRRYLKTVSPNQLQQLCGNDPEYFHRMLPYALALGVDKRFAKQFGKLPIGPCPYLAIGADTTMRASQWCALMHRVLSAMTARQYPGIQERITKVLHLFAR